jgi:hypothetical protein
MIISDRYRFCFIHIPKCAGTYVRTALQRFDDMNGRFAKGVVDHHSLGPIDSYHIPLSVLREHFPEEFDRILHYEVFALVRDPYSRFPSSLSQHLRMHGRKAFHYWEMSRDELRREAGKAVEYLSGRQGDRILPPHYIHFQKQRTYIFDRGRKLVGRVYSTDNVRRLFSDIEALTGHNGRISIEDDFNSVTNRSVVYRNAVVKHIVSFVRPLFAETRLLSERQKQFFRDIAYIPRDSKYKDVFESEYIRSFIEDYYKEDIELYRALSHDPADEIDVL